MIAKIVRAGAMLLALAVPLQATSSQAAPKQPVAVMELFTSQGCSSCPPADAVLAAHADRDDVLALSWHVDYWDYLGWADTFASPAHSARQRAYAKVLGEGVYTPQIVVNGVAQGVGHSEERVAAMLRSAAQAQSRNRGFVPLAVDAKNGGYHVSLDAGPKARARVEGATLFLIWFDPHHEVPIARGENAGHSVTYRNTVRGMQMLGSVSDGRLEVRLARDAMSRALPKGRSCALILQQSVGGLPGPILGAAILGDVRPG